ncbi:TPA: hypothetical protein ROI02_005253, partial [Escherichia coli]|nr:hypothetical protein [Escherichia coli]HBB5938117.1 hypothetical protein [Escherichia coli]HCC6348622.1 hypothetical protein [Escherichia coli]HCC7617668.1 hypothetical protein [Escherichia coli]HCR8814514.1 hypothetical protein [Escherichia coli]
SLDNNAVMGGGKTFQHISFVSNAHVDLDFELKEQLFFREQGIFGEQKHKVMERGECIKKSSI